MVVSDIILDGELPERVARDVYAYVGCISGAAGREEYFSWLREAGFSQVEVLRDVDYVAGLEEAAPEEVRAFAERTGIDPADVRGKIRSVTYRATRPASCCAPSCCA
jgi:predicted xylose isomerase-like sugar epimerase